MKLSPTLGDHLTVIQGKRSYPAVVIELKPDVIRCRVEGDHGPRVMTFRPDGHGHNGARLHPAKRARGVRVAGAVE